MLSIWSLGEWLHQGTIASRRFFNGYFVTCGTAKAVIGPIFLHLRVLA